MVHCRSFTHSSVSHTVCRYATHTVCRYAIHTISHSNNLYCVGHSATHTVCRSQHVGSTHVRAACNHDSQHTEHHAQQHAAHSYNYLRATQHWLHTQYDHRQHTEFELTLLRHFYLTRSALTLSTTEHTCNRHNTMNSTHAVMHNTMSTSAQPTHARNNTLDRTELIPQSHNMSVHSHKYLMTAGSSLAEPVFAE